MKFAPAVPLLALALAVAAAAPSHAQPASNQVPLALTTATAAFDAAFRSGDSAAVAAYLADDCIATSAAGRVETKKQFLDQYLPMAQQLSSKQVAFDTFQRSNVQARVYGKTVVLAGALDLHTHIVGVPSSDMQPVHYRFTQIWVQQPNGWKLAASQNGIVSKAAGTSSQPPL